MRTFLRNFVVATTVALTVTFIAEWRRARQAGHVPFNRVRVAMNSSVNPWLVRAGAVGGAHSEIGTIEHIGRVTGEVHLTPVHPTLLDDRVWIPLPYGETSQWAKNVLAAGHCRLRLHDTVYDLDEPQIVPPADDPLLSPRAARVAGWLGIAYLRLHQFESPAIVPTRESALAPVAQRIGETLAAPVAEPALEEAPVHA